MRKLLGSLIDSSMISRNNAIVGRRANVRFVLNVIGQKLTPPRRRLHVSVKILNEKREKVWHLICYIPAEGTEKSGVCVFPAL